MRMLTASNNRPPTSRSGNGRASPKRRYWIEKGGQFTAGVQINSRPADANGSFQADLSAPGRKMGDHPEEIAQKAPCECQEETHQKTRSVPCEPGT